MKMGVVDQLLYFAHRHHICWLSLVTFACFSVTAMLLLQSYSTVEIALRKTDARHEKLPGRILNYTKYPVKERQKLLLEHIHSSCRSYNLDYDMPPYNKYSLHFLPKYAIINKKHNLMFCGIPKAGVSSWKKVFLQLQGTYSGIFNNTADIHHYFVHHNQNLKYDFLHNVPYDEKQEIIETYLKFTSARNPFERLLSAYRQKLETKNAFNIGFHDRFGANILSLRHDFRNDADRVTFPEFVDFILSQHRLHKPLNIHWAPMYKLCRPCHVKYDMVVKFETLEEDAQYVLQVANLSNVVEFPKEDTHVTNSSRSSTLKFYYSQLSRDTIDAIYEMYKPDFLLYGYGYPMELLL